MRRGLVALRRRRRSPTARPWRGVAVRLATGRELDLRAARGVGHRRVGLRPRRRARPRGPSSRPQVLESCPARDGASRAHRYSLQPAPARALPRGRREDLGRARGWPLHPRPHGPPRRERRALLPGLARRRLRERHVALPRGGGDAVRAALRAAAQPGSRRASSNGCACCRTMPQCCAASARQAPPGSSRPASASRWRRRRRGIVMPEGARASRAVLQRAGNDGLDVRGGGTRPAGGRGGLGCRVGRRARRTRRSDPARQPLGDGGRRPGRRPPPRAELPAPGAEGGLGPRRRGAAGPRTRPHLTLCDGACYGATQTVSVGKGPMIRLRRPHTAL